MNIVRLIYMILLLAGCEGPILNENHSPVLLQGNGDYIYNFKYSDDCLTDEQIKACAEIQLKNRKLIPSECSNGIEVLYGRGPDGGGSLHAIFRCR